jgi:predicted HD superfamily hydrolase involved in NAD metabolism
VTLFQTKRLLKTLLSLKRFQHAEAVADWAVELAAATRLNLKRVYLAGLLHDCARDLSQSALAAVLKKYRGKYWNAAWRSVPELWHNPAGVYIAYHRFGIRDSGILRAIALHSVGAPDMTLLDKVIYVADFTAPGRTYPDCLRARAFAVKSLQRALQFIAHAKVRYLKKHQAHIHSDALGLLSRLRK